LKKAEGGDREQNYSISWHPHLVGLIDKCQIHGQIWRTGRCRTRPCLGLCKAGGQGREQKTGWGDGGGGVNLRVGCDQGASRYKGLTNTF
jgi:hypothetical protein